MSEAAAHILREAKGLHQSLKDSLKTHDVSDREIEINRKNLRRQYLRLLFLHPYARESKDAETAMWMQTSYSLISIYKQRIAALDRAISHPPRQGQQSNHQPRTVEYRKLLQRFRQFLAEEEKFWTQLILRIRRHFVLDDAQPALTALGIAYEDEQASAPVAADGATSPTTTRRNQFQFPPELDSGEFDIPPSTAAQRESRVAILSKALVCLGDIARYKEQYNESGGRPRAGHEDGPPATFVGRNGRGRRGGGPANHMALPRLRNYDRAQSCYEQARMLLPHDGNPSHQLAILSSYQKDTFSSLVHYYRALCVRQPYDTASENLGTVLNKTLELYRSKGLQKERDMQADAANGGVPAPRVRVEAFKEKVVILHALWCMNIEEAKSMGDIVVKDFADLVGDRILPIDMISKVVILAQGALWKYRMARRPGHGDRRHSKSPATESHIVTHLISTHRVLLTNGSVELAEAPPEDAEECDLAQRITATFRRTLPALRMAGKWLRANTRYISQGRRLVAGGEDGSAPVTPSRGGRDRKHIAPPVIVGGLDEFWCEYAQFCTTLIRTFPVDALPKLRTQLEEDVEMAGFLPLRKFMMGPDGRVAGTGPGPGSGGALSPRGSDGGNGKVNGHANGQQLEERKPTPRDQVHPNEEQLMRISDILADAQAIAEDENTPVVFEGGQFVLKEQLSSEEAISKFEQLEGASSRTTYGSITTVDSERSSVGLAQPPSSRPSEPEEDAISVTTRTDDDPVREAFLQALSDSASKEDEQEDNIVWSPTGPLSPRQDPIVNVLPITPPRLNPIGTNSMGLATPRRAEPLSPPRKQLDMQQQQRSPPSASFNKPLTTAQDLLNDVMSLHRTPNIPRHSRGLSAPPVNMLFGSGGPGNSIWSDAGDSKPFQYQSPSHLPSVSNGASYISQPSQIPGPSLPLSQTSWSSSVPWQSPVPSQSQNTPAQQNFIGSPVNVPVNGPFISQQTAVVNGGHHRVPSELSMTHNQPYGQSIHSPRFNPFNGYNGPSALQEPIVLQTTNVGVIGRGHPTTTVSDPLPSHSHAVPGGYAYTQRQIESAFYNIPNVGSPNQLGGERVLPPQYGPTSPASRIWSNAG